MDSENVNVNVMAKIAIVCNEVKLQMVQVDHLIVS